MLAFSSMQHQTNLKMTPGDGKSGNCLIASDNCLILSDSHIVSTIKNTCVAKYNVITGMAFSRVPSADIKKLLLLNKLQVTHILPHGLRWCLHI